MSPLHHACKKGRLKCVKYLCEKCEFDPDLQDSVGMYSSLHWAAANGHLAVVQYLVQDRGANITSKTCVLSTHSLTGQSFAYFPF